MQINEKRDRKDFREINKWNSNASSYIPLTFMFGLHCNFRPFHYLMLIRLCDIVQSNYFPKDSSFFINQGSHKNVHETYLTLMYLNLRFHQQFKHRMSNFCFCPRQWTFMLNALSMMRFDSCHTCIYFLTERSWVRNQVKCTNYVWDNR